MSEVLWPDIPYKGLLPYSEADAPFFFGRERERKIILANLMAKRLTLLYGPSGVGKSSLLRAGVIPHIHQLAWKNVDERDVPEYALVSDSTLLPSEPIKHITQEFGPFGVLVFSSWHDDPLSGLVNSIRTSVRGASEIEMMDQGPSPSTLTDMLKVLTDRLDMDLFVILDQFEDYLRYYSREQGEETFAAEFARAVTSPDLRVNFLISVREDWFDKLDCFKDRIPNLFDNPIRIEKLDREAARDAIRKPLDAYNSTWSGNQILNIEEELVEAIIAQVTIREGTPGTGWLGWISGTAHDGSLATRIDAPFLQMVLCRLWEEEMAVSSRTLRRSTLKQLGEADQIVRAHLDRVIARLSTSERDVASKVFRFLVTPMGIKIAHTLGDLAFFTDQTQAQVQSVLTLLSAPDARIIGPGIVVQDQPEEQCYEIFHHMLTPAILEWQQRYEAIMETERWRIEQKKWMEQIIRLQWPADNRVFAQDIIGRYITNTWQEAIDSTDTSRQPSARSFDIIVIGCGTFGGVLAQHLFYNDRMHSHRILVLDAGRLVLPEHIQNLPMLGLNVPDPILFDPGILRNEVWGLPWRTDMPGGFPGLAYCLGGRSIFSGGWSPQPLEAEMEGWPQTVTENLHEPMPDGSAGYFGQAGDQTGITETNDFIYGPLHNALRSRLFEGIKANKVPDVYSLDHLPNHPAVGSATATIQNLLNLLGIPVQRTKSRTVQDLLNLLKLEAPLAVQARPPRSGFFPLNKFSSVPLLMEAACGAQHESGGDNAQKRLMVVTNCHVRGLITEQEGRIWRVSAVETSLGTVHLPPNGKIVLALGTIESTRLALISFPNLHNSSLIGHNLMTHLRSTLVIRIPRSALPSDLPNDLQTSALFIKGRHTYVDGLPGHFHVQITAAGLGKMGTYSEAQLFKKIPDIDTLSAFRHANDDYVVITIRSIGEMQPQNPNSHIGLTPELDEHNYPRAFVSIQPTNRDIDLWEAMDRAVDEIAKVFAGGHPYEGLTPSGFKPVRADQAVSEVVPFRERRESLGATHHEAGTLWMGDNPASSITNPDGRLHDVSNAYVAGPAIFPTIGSCNPILTGVALARRLGDHLVPPPTPYITDGFIALFDGLHADNWRMAGRGRFFVVNGALEAVPGDDLGLYWCTMPMPPDFILMLDWRCIRADDRSGVFVRFPNPDSKGYENTSWVGVHFGFEVQISEFGGPDGVGWHKTGAIYGQQNQALTQKQAHPVGEWNEYKIRVQGQTYTVWLNGQQVSEFTFTLGSDAQHPDRGLPSTPADPRFIGLQAENGNVQFRNIRIVALPQIVEAVVRTPEAPAVAEVTATGEMGCADAKKNPTARGT